MLCDARRRAYHWEVLKEAEPGQDLVLTIDETIQYIASSELEKAVRENEAAWGTVIVSHPGSGEILAMATAPSYDPNDYPPPDPRLMRNLAIQENFEPGSTFKIVTAAAAREFDVVDFNDRFDCSQGFIRVPGYTIRDHKRMGVLTFAEVIIDSSNVGTVKVGQRVGEENLYRMIKAFGFGEKTGIELPGEENGICHPTDRWSKSSLASHSIGYGISVTAIQVLQAMNVIANRGRLIPPRISRDAVDRTGFPPAATAAAKRVISERTAAELIDNIFAKVAIEGTAAQARLDGFTVAGKTGTAQRSIPGARGYSSGRHLASFVGFVPASDPALSIVVVIDDPKAKFYYGGLVAAPVFREIARRALLYLNQFPEFDPSRKDHHRQSGRGGLIMKLKDLFRNVPGVDIAGNGDPEIRGLAYSSLQVQPGDLFAALRGGKTDGLRFVDDAQGRGAAAVLAEVPRPQGQKSAWVKALDAREALALAAANFYDHPSMKLKIVGITGTKGQDDGHLPPRVDPGQGGPDAGRHRHGQLPLDGQAHPPPRGQPPRRRTCSGCWPRCSPAASAIA